jgi:hypothetical protein
MPRFAVRTQDPNSDEFREHRIVAEDQDAAVEIIERAEAKYANYEAPSHELDQLLAAEADEVLSGNERGRLHMHRQTEPYVIASIRNLSADTGRKR